jgi:16S rRNA (guanine527-N7)-methyltransferase
MSIREKIASGASKFAACVEQHQVDKLYQYANLLMSWNKRCNLTACKNIEDLIDKHLLDSLSASCLLTPDANILDLGTGGGLPGIPLSIMYPDKKFTLLDTNGKKVRFLLHVIYKLQLNNVKAICMNASVYKPLHRFDIVLSRAVASLPKLWELSSGLLTPDGFLVAMKGVQPVEEMLLLSNQGIKVTTNQTTEILNIGERHLIKIAL